MTIRKSTITNVAKCFIAIAAVAMTMYVGGY